MKFDVGILNNQPVTDVARQAQLAEALGYDTVVDHRLAPRLSRAVGDAGGLRAGDLEDQARRRRDRTAHAPLVGHGERNRDAGGAGARAHRARHRHRRQQRRDDGNERAARRAGRHAGDDGRVDPTSGGRRQCAARGRPGESAGLASWTAQGPDLRRGLGATHARGRRQARRRRDHVHRRRSRHPTGWPSVHRARRGRTRRAAE